MSTAPSAFADLSDAEIVSMAERALAKGQLGDHCRALIEDAGSRHRADHILTPAQRDNLARVLAGEPIRHTIVGVHPERQPTEGENPP